jgi:class 3 adenylate cyclase/tetratricopeptide (TPR) repeat protein
MKCTQCHHDVRPGAKFCEVCGAQQTLTCPSCGTTALASSAKFCLECGQALAEMREHGKAVVSLPALDGERKLVTVLFADLKGSLELIADRDPEEARKILDPVIDVMMEAVHEYEGTVNQVMGDGIMALFGAPLAHEGHAVRACYAALRMQERALRYADEVRRAHGVTVEIRIGLNSGEVVVRTIGTDQRMDYSAVGQTTHLAARMEQMAEPGSILATADTIWLAEGYIEAVSRGPVHVRGLAAPIDVYVVTGSGTARTPFQAAATRGLTRFIGREGEVAQLDRALASTAQRRGQVVGVVGESGVGKSRLFHEFTSSRLRDGWLVLHASTASYTKMTAYRPVVDLLQLYFRLDSAGQRDVSEIVRARLAALDPSLMWALAPLLALLQPDAASAEWQALDRRQRRQQTLDAVRRLVLRESEVQPTCLVLEDLHWIDSETHAFLDSLIDTLPTARLLVLLNYRPEFQHGWSSKTSYSQLRLNALGEDNTRAFLSALVGDRGDLGPVKRLLVERTGGNPFFLEESVRTLVENGALTGERGDYRLARAVHVVEVPSTVQAVLAARIDRLAAEDKRLLQCASVIGEHVPVGLLLAVADVSPDEGRDALARLLAGEFVYESRFVPEPEYVFAHGLTRQVAYRSLLQERRRGLHARVVDYIERQYPDRLVDHVERLAEHARRAELWDRAARYLRQAGAKAFAHSANREAVAWFEEALQALGHLPEVAETQAAGVDVRLGLRNALTLLGEHERTLEQLCEAEQLAERTGDRARLGRVLSFKANALLLLGRHEQAIDAGRFARELANERGDVPLRTATDLYLGRAHLFLGSFQEAIEIFQGVVETLTGERASDHLGLPILPSVFARSHLVECLVELGRLADSARYANEAVALAEARNHPDTLLWAYHGAGVHHLAAGDVKAATAAFERAHELCLTHDMPAYLPRISAELALAMALGGRATEAVAMVQRATEEAATRRQAASYSQALLLLGEVCLLASRTGEASAAGIEALERFRRQGERAHEAWALCLLGDVATQGPVGDVIGAAAHYRAARDIAVTLGMKPLSARCDRALEHLASPPGKPGGLD